MRQPSEAKGNQREGLSGELPCPNSQPWSWSLDCSSCVTLSSLPNLSEPPVYKMEPPGCWED